MNDDEKIPTLIQCGDHKWSPWAIVCVHLIENPTIKWLALDLAPGDQREIDNDYCCQKCFDNYEKESQWDVNTLRPVCIHCLRKLKGC